MEDINSLAGQIEQLRKEIKYIVKVIIPSLKLGGDTSSLQAQVTSNTQAIATSQGKIETLEESVSSLTSSVSQNASGLSEANADIEDHNQRITFLEMSNSTMGSSLQGQAVQITLLENGLSTANDKINTNEITLLSQSSKLTSLEQSLNTANGKITALEASLSTLSATVQNLTESLAQSGGETVVVIYDMNSSDTAVNRGYTTGIVGGNVINHDFSQYKRVVFYGSLNKSDCIATINLDKRQYTDATLHTAGTLLNKVWYLKVVIPVAKDRVSINYAGAYEVDSAGALTFTRTKGDAAYFIYRIEGIK